ncbi:MAG TPA: preprotein translocase subunit YajC [Pseudonocardia sp.]
MDISLLFPIIILLLFIPIFLSSRKQKRAQQQMAALQTSLEPGDVVSTTSGLRGTIVDTSYEDTIDLEIADGVVTTWVRAAIRERITAADEPVATEGEGSGVIAASTAPAERPSLDKAPAAGEATVGESTIEESTPREATSVESTPRASTLDDAELDKVALEKDDSTNGSPRS